MPTLTTQQIADLQDELDANDVSGFYALLESYGDSYGRLGAAVTDNSTWQGELANAFAAYAAGDDAVNLSYESTAWNDLNKAIADDYLQAYRDNSNSTPSWDVVQTIHNTQYGFAGLDADDWLPNKLLNDSADPTALWADYLANDGAGDLIGDAFGIATDNILALTLPPLFMAQAATDMPGLIAGATYTDNLLNAFKDLSSTAKQDMASDFTGTDIGALMNMLDGLGDDVRGFFAQIPAIIDDASPWLEKVLPDWITGPLSAFGNAKTNASPLCLDLDSDGVELTAFNAGTTTTFFDIDGDSYAEQTAWVSADDGLLVRDLDESGTVDSVEELFGSPTIDGFAKLALLDGNDDLIIDQYDDAWGSLRVWKDANADAVTQDGELLTLGSLGIVSIDLAGVTASTSTINGNAISHTSTFRYDNGSTGAIVDAWFVNDNVNTYYTGDYALDIRAVFLPTLRGFGKLPDLHIATSQDSTLLGLVEDLATGFSFDSWTDSAALDSAIEDILFRWAGVDAISPTSRGPNVDAQHLEFLEEMFGEEFLQEGFRSNPLVTGGELVEASYEMVFAQLKTQLLAQTGAQALYDGDAVYNVFTGEIEGSFTLLPSAVDALEAIASGVGVDAEAFWIEVAKFIDASKGSSNLTTQEETWLDDAVYASDPSLTWAGIVSELPDLSGTVYFQDIYGTTGADTITGSYINERIFAYAGNDVIDPGAGGDLVYDNGGNDTYRYTSGSDVYQDGSGTEVIELPTGITLNDLAFYRGSVDSLFITVGSLGEIEIDEFYNGTSYRVETLRFADTSTYDLTAIASIEVFGSEDADDITAEDNIAETIYGLGGDDELTGGGGNDTIDGGAGNDTLSGGSGNDSFIVSAGFDRIIDSASTYNTLIISAGYTSDDVHYFKNGNDIIVMVTDLGQATIVGQASGSGYEIDEIHFEETDTTILYADVAVEQRGGTGNDSFTGTTNSDILNGMAGNDSLSGGAGNDIYVFSEGQDAVYESGGSADKILFWDAWQVSDIDAYRAQSLGTSYDDLVLADQSGNKITIESFFDSPSGNGKVEGVVFSDSTTWDLTTMTFEIWGTSGNDNISVADSAGMVLRPFGGNDTVWGYTGDDTFIYSAGLDTLIEYAGSDTLSITNGITVGDISIADVGLYNIKITINAGTDEVTLNNFRQSSIYKVETILFDDGFHADLTTYSSWLWGTSGNDTIAGNASANVLIGKDGNDTIDAGGANDNAHGGAGTDTIDGGDGDDLLYGGDGDDILAGGDGLDTMVGGAGADTFVFKDASAFNDIDVVQDFDVANDNDVLDISDILDMNGYQDGVDTLTDWVEITDSGSDSAVKIDVTGTGTFGAGTQVATLIGITGLTDESALVTSGNLLVA
jgi:Ca2+-binding RTX toxin-like protein